MARTPRLNAPWAAYHVMARGIERRNIFRDDSDRRDFVARLERLLPEERWRCFVWVLLPNHYHLVLQSTGGRLSRLMARLNTGYARAFNRRHDRVGYLFQNRFKSRLVRDDADLMGLILYVSRNPLRAGLVRSLKGLEDYRWSGLGALTGRRPALPFESTIACLSVLGDDVDDARARLRRRLLEAEKPSLPRTGVGRDKAPRAGETAGPASSAGPKGGLMGADATTRLETFVAAKPRLLAQRPAEPSLRPSSALPEGAIRKTPTASAPTIAASQEAPAPPETPSSRPAKIRLPADSSSDASHLIRLLIDEAARALGVQPRSALDRPSRAQATQARSIAAAIATDHLGLSRSAIAAPLEITPTAVTHAARRGRSLLSRLRLHIQPPTPPRNRRSGERERERGRW